ncbi:MAG: phosphate regulon transcriptional regulatory protein PhoB [Rickettsiales bacterium]|nr:phosphate regulon transcriptional regulatory protein PhoB [Rickettsiales bacterium]
MTQKSAYTKRELQPSVLIVEDESAIVTMLTYNLEKEGFRVRSTDNGEEALILVDESKPDIILLDWMLPSMSGIEICRTLRRKPETTNIPIIMLSARGEETDRIEGLERGADDYLVKPFSPKELISRIRAVFRRIRPAFTQEQLTFDGLVMDLTTKRITRHNTVIHMGPTEFRILQCLMEHPSRVLSRDQLIRKVWGFDTDVEPRTVDVHINRLRKALDYDGNQHDVIKTVRSAGYCLRLAEEEEE